MDIIVHLFPYVKKNLFPPKLYPYTDKKNPPLGGFFYIRNYLTDSLSVLPARKTGDFIAGITIFAFDFGFTPFRCAR